MYYYVLINITFCFNTAKLALLINCSGCFYANLHRLFVNAPASTNQQYYS